MIGSIGMRGIQNVEGHDEIAIIGISTCCVTAFLKLLECV